MNVIYKVVMCEVVCILIMVRVSKVSDTYIVYKTVYYIQVVM